ncbi:MAG TPA: SRPBCC domain-containing protein [Polyangiaceae bacterium]|nr:SRPBCC domain-containing protein [Polyangiaceae bacterium]
MAKTELRSEVEIDAPLSHVYAVLADFRSYESWNPFITAVSGALVVGDKLSLELSLPEGKTYLLAPEVTQVSQGSERAELRWRTRFMSASLLEAEQLFLLSERRPGVTRVVQGLDFSGFLLRFAGTSLTLCARGCVYMGQALKKRAEATR